MTYIYLLGIGFTNAAYTQSAGIGHTFASHIQPLTGPIHLAIYLFLSVSYPLAITIITSIGYNRKLLNLVKIYTNNGKYSSHNNNFIFKLAIFYNISLRVDVLSKVKIKIFFTMLKSLTLDYYYLNISISGIIMNFNQVYYLIKIRRKINEIK